MTVTLSVVVPVYSGERYLRDLARAVDATRARLEAEGAPFRIEEMILVNDAARDGSPAIVDALAAEHAWIVGLHLSRNFGQHPATIAGILHSAGDWIVTLDEDLQHPPDRIPELLARAVGEGADIVYARASSGVHDSAMRDLTSRGFKRLMQWLTGNPALREFNSFRLVRGAIARAACAVLTHDTYLDIGLSWFTQRIVSLEMELKDARFIQSGQSGYSLRSLLSHAWRMLFSSQIKLLRIGAAMGFAVVTLSLLGSLYFLGLRILAPERIPVQGWTSLFLLVSLLGGLLALMMGVALQYLSTLVLRAHGKPTFFTVDRSADAALARWFAARPARAAAPETPSRAARPGLAGPGLAGSGLAGSGGAEPVTAGREAAEAPAGPRAPADALPGALPGPLPDGARPGARPGG
jgi:glycosyltransferase involved in cell wall biosynthesis